MDLLDVPPGMLAQYGAVSEEVAGAMADGARAALHADYALSITGVAGPDGGTAEKPVGLVYLGCAGPGGTTVRRGVFPGDRDTVRMFSATSALHLLRTAAPGVSRPPQDAAAQAPAPVRRLRPAPGGRARRPGLAAQGALAPRRPAPDCPRCT